MVKHCFARRKPFQEQQLHHGERRVRRLLACPPERHLLRTQSTPENLTAFVLCAYRVYSGAFFVTVHMFLFVKLMFELVVALA